MSMFLCLIRTDGAPIADHIRQRYARRRESQTISPTRWHLAGPFAALTGSDIRGVMPRVVHVNGWTGVGIAHLHRAAGSIASATAADRHIGDLEHLVAAVAQHGPEAVRSLHGDFAFVCWHSLRREIIAARDTFGVWCLHMARHGQLLAFSTRASVLAGDNSYDLDFIAEYLVTGHGVPGHTAFRNVEALRPAEVYRLAGHQETRSRYWFVPAIGWDAQSRGPRDDDIVERYRTLLSTSVTNALDQRSDVWSELSGGMDSSSIVATATSLASQGLLPHGLAGVVTYDSTAGSGGDHDHAAIVGQHCAIPLASMRDWWGWQDDDQGPPLFDQPGRAATYALARRVTRLVHEAGGRVLLSGLGADLCLRPYLDSAADRLAIGDIRGCVTSLLQWAGATRTSFWRMAYEHGLYPLLPTRVRQLLARPAWRVPDWIAPTFARTYELRGRTAAVALYKGPAGDKVRTALDARFQTGEQYMHREMLGEDNLEWRYPFLDRALVAFALAQSREWRYGSGISKRLLREAMRGLLPPSVRTRRGKGSLHPDQRLALRRERQKLMTLFRSSLLGRLGCVVPERLIRALATAHENRDGSSLIAIYNALTLEIWLQSRHDQNAVSGSLHRGGRAMALGG